MSRLRECHRHQLGRILPVSEVRRHAPVLPAGAALGATLPAVATPVSVRFQASNPHACTYLDTHAVTLVPHAHTPFAGLRHPTRSGVFPSTAAPTSTPEIRGATSTRRATRPGRPASTSAAPASPTRTWSHRSTSTGSRSPRRTISGANRRVAAVGAWRRGGRPIIPASPRTGPGMHANH